MTAENVLFQKTKKIKSKNQYKNVYVPGVLRHTF